jgi:hypothetical protein
MEYTNPDNVVVTVNGIRARTSAGIEYLADGTTDYLLPTTGLLTINYFRQRSSRVCKQYSARCWE